LLGPEIRIGYFLVHMNKCLKMRPNAVLLNLILKLSKYCELHMLVFGKDSNKNQNFIHEEIKRRLNSGNSRYHSVQNTSEHLVFSSAV
jgi:hypothetical protein